VPYQNPGKRSRRGESEETVISDDGGRVVAQE